MIDLFQEITTPKASIFEIPTRLSADPSIVDLSGEGCCFKSPFLWVSSNCFGVEDGTVLKTFNHLLHRNRKVDFIEQFNEKLLVKQENENLHILDVRNSELTEVSRTEFMTPSAFIFLYEKQLFLTFRNKTVDVWNFRGELVTSFEDHLLWHPDCNTNNIYITSDQDLIISYCKVDFDDPLTEGSGSINISNILTGKCLADPKFHYFR
ncbi:unnamed protein product [Lactuca saligna]|uniref:Uncharacterized protein n=1 Tax=Lactuca saligna TaxID=75948 RepID=A0AA35USQ6_LACSI|nr:unnamed protein product [Lactuca saligna]